MPKFEITSLKSGGLVEVELTIPHRGTATFLRREHGQDVLRLHLDIEGHQELLNAATRWTLKQTEEHSA